MKLIIRVPNIPTVKELFNNIYKGSSWKRDDYNSLFHNFQDFICKIIDKLDAVRPKYEYFRCFHNNSIAEYPSCIVNQLEKNENVPSQFPDKIPLIGPMEESIRLFVYGLYLIIKNKK